MWKRGKRLLITGFCCAFLLSPAAGSAFDQPWDSGHNTTGFGGGGPGGPPGGGGQGGGGDPVNLKAGNFNYSGEDIMIPALGPPLFIIRYYNSQDRYIGPFGYGWHFLPFMGLLEVMRGEEKLALVKRGDGVRLEFRENSDGVTYARSSGGWNDTLKKEGAGWVLRTQDGTLHSFDVTGKIVSSTDRNGNSLSYGYDGQGRLVTLSDANGRELALAYGSNGKIASVTDFTGRTFPYEYDVSENLVSVIDPLNQITSYAYDTKHRLLTVTDPEGRVVIENTYDSQNRVVTQDHTGGTLTFTYNPDYTRIQNRRGFNSDVYFNAQGNPTRFVPPQPEQTTYFSFDADTQVIAVRDTDGTTQIGYDGEGNIVSVESPSGAVTSFTYEQQFRQITSETDPLNHTTYFSYDGKGNLERVTDALARLTDYEYDENGKLIKVSFPDGSVTRFTRSADGRVTSISDTASGGSSAYTVTFDYDPLGNVVGITRPGGSTASYQYDALNRLTRLEDNSFSPARVYEYEYTGSGSVSKIIENGKEKRFEYTNHRVTGVTFPDGSSVSYSYNENDLITQATFALGSLVYTYDNMDRVTALTNPNGSTVSFTYQNDYVTEINGPGANLQLLYDAERRLTGIHDLLTNKEVSFRYDDAGNRTQMLTTTGGTTAYTTTYTYDVLNRLSSVVDPQNQTTNYSPPIAKKETTVLNEIVSAYNLNQNNRLVRLVSRRGSGDAISLYSYEFPDVYFWAKSIEANKRWNAQVDQDFFDKRGFLRLRTPFEIIR